MIKYILKRLIIVIPTLFVISLVTFGLSLVTPGDPVLNKVKGKANAEGVVEQSGGQDYKKASRDLGLDRPAFYFTLTSEAYPDTFHRIINKRERLRYKGLIEAYGNWDAIKAFDEALYHFEVNTVQSDNKTLPSEAREKALKKMSTLITNIKTKVWAKDLEQDLLNKPLSNNERLNIIKSKTNFHLAYQQKNDLEINKKEISQKKYDRNKNRIDKLKSKGAKTRVLRGSKEEAQQKESPMNMKKQGYNARLDDSLGSKNGKKSQSMKDRRDESKAMSKKMYGHAYGADKGMSYRHTSSWKTHDHLRS